MITEALLLKLKSLRTRLAELSEQRAFTEMSDEMAFSNGKLGAIDRDIMQAKKELSAFYLQHPVRYGGADTNLTIECLAGDTFTFQMNDFSKPGLVRKISITLTSEEMSNLRAYLGNQLVDQGATRVDAALAYDTAIKRISKMQATINRLTVENQALEFRLAEKENGT